MDKLSLKPCPFCGSSKIEFRDIAQQTLVAVCCGCNAEGGYTTLAAGSTSRDEAAEFWNTRSEGLPPPGGGGGDKGFTESQTSPVGHGALPMPPDGEEFLEFKEALDDVRRLRAEYEDLNGGGPGWGLRNAAAWKRVAALFADEDEAAWHRQQEDAHG